MWAEFLVGLVSSAIVTLVALWSPLGKRLAIKLFQLSGVTVCPHRQRASSFNQRFYKAFAERVANARSSFWITGEGIVGDTDEEKRLAAELVDALRMKLGHPDFRVVRVQTTIDVSDHWLDLMDEFLSRYGDRFHLYFAPTQVLYACVIDPGDAHASSAEMMMPAQSIHDPTTEVAGFGVFIDRRPELATYLRDKIQELIQGAISFDSFRRIAQSQAERFDSLPSEEQLADRRALRALVLRITSSEELREYLGIVRQTLPQTA